MTAGYTSVICPLSTTSYFSTRCGDSAAVNLWSVSQGLRTGVPPRARSTT
jgi:hypothetical protein